MANAREVQPALEQCALASQAAALLGEYRLGVADGVGLELVLALRDTADSAVSLR